MVQIVWREEIQTAVSERWFGPSEPGPEDNAGDRLLWTPISDTAAARDFLNIKSGSTATERRYSRELYRFFLWMHHEGVPALKMIVPGHIEGYLAFCIEPPESWCANTGGPTLMSSPKWRPFKERTRPSVNSVQNTLSILKSFFAYLQNVGYLRGDPTRSIDGRYRGSVMAAAAAMSEHGHGDYPCRPGKEPDGFSTQQWQCLLETVETLPQMTPVQVMKRERATYVVQLLYYTAARSEEARSHTHKALNYDVGRDCWTVTFYGKGAKKRVLPIHPQLMIAIQRFRQFHGLPPFPDNEALPLFPNYRVFDKHQPVFRPSMSERGAEDWVKSLFRQAQDRFAYFYPEERHKCAIHFKDATLHTIRHTRARHMLFVEKIDLRLVQAFLGHSKILTTQGYTEPSMDEMLRAVRG